MDRTIPPIPIVTGKVTIQLPASLWSASVPHSPADIGSVRTVQGQMNGDSPGYFTVTNGAWVHTIDNQGNVVEEFKCFTETEQGTMPLARLGTGCQAAITISDSLYAIDINNFLHRYVKFEDTGEWAIKHPGFSQAT